MADDPRFPASLAGAEVSDIDLNDEEFMVGGERLTDAMAEEMSDEIANRHQAADRTFRVVWSDEDGEFVGLCDQHPFLSHLDPDEAAAMAGIRELVAAVDADIAAEGR